MLKRSLFIFVFLVVMVSGTASATDYYVDNGHASASDANPGTELLPFETISYGITQLSQYDTLYIVGNGNVYPEYVQLNTYNVVDDVSIIGIGIPEIRDGSQSDGTLQIGKHNDYTGGVHNITVIGIKVYNNASETSREALHFNYKGNSSYISFYDCNFSSNLSQGVYFRQIAYPDHVILDNCTIYGATDAIGSYDQNWMSNITIRDCYIQADDGHGISITTNSGDDLLFENNTVVAKGDGIKVTSYSDNVTIRHNTISAGVGATGGTDGTGIFIKYIDNSSVYSNDILTSFYTGLKQGATTNTDVYSNAVTNYGHNAIEVKGSYMHYRNLTVLGHNTSIGDAWNVFYAAGDAQETQNLIEDISANDTIDRLILTGGHQNHTIYRNVSVTNHSGVSVFIYGYDSGGEHHQLTSDGLVFDNFSVENNGDGSDNEYPIIVMAPGTSPWNDIYDYANYSRDNITFIDYAHSGTNPLSTFWITDKGNVRIHDADIYAINVNSLSSYWDFYSPERCTSVLHEMYYADIYVKDSENNPIEGATLTFSANVTNPETGATLKPHNIDYGTVAKGYTNELDSVTTGSDGHTSLPSDNRTNTVALSAGMQYFDSSEQYQPVEWNITATYDGVYATETVVMSDVDYRADPSIAPRTIIITLDVDTGSSGAPLSITDYTPIDLTPTAIYGEPVTFSVTTNKAADISFYADGTLKESGTDISYLEYEKIGSIGIHNVTAIAVNGTDSVQQTWILTVEAAASGGDETGTTSSILTHIYAIIAMLAIVPVIMIGAFVMSAYEGGEIDTKPILDLVLGIGFCILILYLIASAAT